MVRDRENPRPPSTVHCAAGRIDLYADRPCLVEVHSARLKSVLLEVRAPKVPRWAGGDRNLDGADPVDRRDGYEASAPGLARGAGERVHPPGGVHGISIARNPAHRLRDAHAR